MVACHGNQRDPSSGPTGPRQSSPLETSAYVPPDTAVLTVTSNIASDVPAGMLDAVAFFAIEVRPEEGDPRRLDLPPTGTGVLTFDEVSGPTIVEIGVMSPMLRLVSSNQIRLASIGGTVGVLALDVSSAAPRRGCRRCSAPELLLDIPGLHETGVFWSASGPTPDAVDAVFHVAIRDSSEQLAAENCVVGLGATVGQMSSQPEIGLGWWIVVTPEHAEPMAFARSVSGCVGVKGLELYAPNGSGMFWPGE